MHDIFHYYGLDWAVMCLGLIGFMMIGNMKREGFILSLIASAGGIVIAIWAQQFGYILYNAILMILFMRSYAQWGRERVPARVVALGAE